MELRKAADVFLRSQTNPLASLLNPSSASPWARGTQLCYRRARKPIQRVFSNSTRDSALFPGATTSSTAAPPSSNKTRDSVDSFPKDFWASPSNKTSSSLPQDSEKRMNQGDSADDILRAINRLSEPKKLDVGDMLDPSSPVDNRNFMEKYASGGHLAMPSAPRTPMRLEPSTGRSITIGTGTDFARGLRRLEQSCARNRIRADATKQRFHEREGLKRKRLRRQRWRKRFLEGFQATVGRVRELKNQGW